MSDVHPTAAEIAALDADALEEAERSRVNRHLDDCSSCAELLHDLAVLKDELPALHPVGPMPADIADRIDAALAAQSPPAADDDAVVSREDDAVVSRETPPPQAAPAAPSIEQRGKAGVRRWPLRARFALAAAAAIGVVGAGALVLEALETDTAGNQAGPTSAEGSAEAGGTELDRSPEELEGLEEEVRVLLAEAEDVALDTPFDTSQESPDESADTSVPPEEEASILQDPDEGDGRSDEPQSNATEVPECVVSVIDRTEPPLASSEDYLHEGIDSYVVVLPHTADPEVVDAYVVDAACAEGTPASPSDLLEMQSYAREEP